MRGTWQHVVLVLAIVAVLYLPAVGGIYLFEDRQALASLAVEGEGGGPADAAAIREAALRPGDDGSWRPLSRASLAIQDRAHPHAPRMLNVVLLTVAALAFYVLLRLPALGTRRIPAFFAAAILAAHPVTAASIYHVAEGREMLLGLLFVVLAAALYLRGGWLGALGAALAQALALAATEQALWLPGALVVAEGVGLAGWAGLDTDAGKSRVSTLKKVPKKSSFLARWGRLIPILAVTAVYVVMRQDWLGAFFLEGPVPARAPMKEWLFAWNALALPRRALLPQPDLPQWLPAFWMALPALLLMALVTAVTLIALRHSEAVPPEHRREEGRRVLFWLVLMAVLFPGLTGWPGGRLPYDEIRHLLFLVPVLGLLTWAVSRFWSLDMFRLESSVVGWGMIVILSAVSLGRREYYQSDEIYASHWARVSPGAWRLLARRAEALAGAGRLGPADRAVERGLMLNPEEPVLLTVREGIREKEERWEEALALLDRLAVLEATNLVHQVRAAEVLNRLGRHEAAAVRFSALAEARPDEPSFKEKAEEATRKANESITVKKEE